MQAALAVAKQVVLLCATGAAQQTIDEVMAEAAQLAADETPSDSAAPSRSLSVHGLDELSAFKQHVRAAHWMLTTSTALCSGSAL